jgi:hypothetical protein
MIEIMNELTKKALEYGLSLAFLLGALYYQNSQMENMKDAQSDTNAKLDVCMEERLQLSARVAALEAIVNQGEAAKPTRKSK